MSPETSSSCRRCITTMMAERTMSLRRLLMLSRKNRTVSARTPALSCCTTL